MSEMLYPYVASSSILLPLFLKTQVVEEAKALSKKAKQSLQISPRSSTTQNIRKWQLAT